MSATLVLLEATCASCGETDDVVTVAPGVEVCADCLRRALRLLDQAEDRAERALARW